MSFTHMDAYREEKAIKDSLKDKVQTVADALAFCDELDAQHANGRCVRAELIRSWLAHNPFWSESQSRILACIAAQRNVICLKHKIGSYELDPRRREM